MKIYFNREIQLLKTFPTKIKLEMKTLACLLKKCSRLTNKIYLAEDRLLD